MGEKGQPQDPHEAELGKADQEVALSDAVILMTGAPVIGICGRGVGFGKTSFENHRLNDMIDMVESAQPDHLESAASAMWAARDAITTAATTLHGHIGNVDWQGESANSFRDWGKNLVDTAHSLATYADNVGTHIMAAGAGLASVRKSMPPRDDRLFAKGVNDFPVVERVATNTEYQAASKVEAHRQEAINQMIRLSSYYAVSEGGLATQQAPTFDTLPNVGVPAPKVDGRQEPPNGTTGRSHLPASSSIAREAGTTLHQSADTAGGGHPEETLEPSKHLHDTGTPPNQHVGTHIDGVGTLPPAATKPTTIVTPPTSTNPGGGPVQTVPPFTTGPVPPTVGAPFGRTSGDGSARGLRTPVSGRASTPPGELPEEPVGRGPAGRGPVGPVGRTVSPGSENVRGPASTMGKPPVGRSVTGGIPRAAGEPIEPIGGRGVTGAARTGGVVGGRPSVGAATEGATGSRIPRGTVVGGEEVVPGSPRTGARLGQGRVIGGQSAMPGSPRTGARLGQGRVIGARAEAKAGTAETLGRPARAEDGVVGAPKGKAFGIRDRGLTGAETSPEPGLIGNRGSARTESMGQSRAGRSAQSKKKTSHKEQRDEQSPTD
ncbi:hypothetical protein ABZ845_28400 [Streptomyces sp. NPDC047022]|uniref:WXG100 family type VII secretion target n=1 Tax=Streptomyces sp. NPDC047022 TaxID=3155737 RepID=UPI0033D6A459